METYFLIMVYFIVWYPAVDFFDRDFSFHACESCAETEMGAVAERKVTVGVPVDIELPCRWAEFLFVVVRGADEKQHRIAFLQGVSVQV
tara:strand:- start:46 stop:312 length:267 start_codon:yes stop_codon:yes gene_type:complete